LLEMSRDHLVVNNTFGQFREQILLRIRT